MEIILSNIPGHALLLVLAANFVSKLILYFNFFIWFLPPFRQYKGGFFLYFMILALTDPLGYLLYTIFKIAPYYFYAPSSLFLLFVALRYTASLKPGIILFSSFISLVCTGIFIIYLLNALEVLICIYFIIFNLRTGPRFRPKRDSILSQ